MPDMATVKRVGVVGSGIMGAGLAEVAARAGYDVVVRSRTQSSADAMVSGLRLFSATRSLAIAGWIAGLEPVRLEVSGNQLVLEAGLEDRWLLGNLEAEEAKAAAQAFRAAREQVGGVQAAVDSGRITPASSAFPRTRRGAGRSRIDAFLPGARWCRRGLSRSV